MQNRAVRYFRLPPGAELPSFIDLKPYKAIVIIEDEVTSIWQDKVSRWLVDSGCYYMMAWGRKPNSWDDSVDWASLEAHDFQCTDEDLIMTSWHENQTLEQVFWDAKNLSTHPVHDLKTTIILHISNKDKRSELECLYENA